MTPTRIACTLLAILFLAAAQEAAAWTRPSRPGIIGGGFDDDPTSETQTLLRGTVTVASGESAYGVSPDGALGVFDIWAPGEVSIEEVTNGPDIEEVEDIGEAALTAEPEANFYIAGQETSIIVTGLLTEADPVTGDPIETPGTFLLTFDEGLVARPRRVE